MIPLITPNSRTTCGKIKVLQFEIQYLPDKNNENSFRLLVDE